MRRFNIAVDEHYHIYNRGVGKQVLFYGIADYSRFLFLILYFQSPVKIEHIGRVIKEFVGYVAGQHRVLTRVMGKEVGQEIVKQRVVELVAFCIMPNHFHLIIKECEEGGIAVYMQRVLNAYGKYYNTKYEKTGHVFQGPYKAVHVGDNRQLLHLSAYIHRNPRELRSYFGKEDQYCWSSYADFTLENRWRELLKPDVILDQFEGREEYRDFVHTSPAKLIEGLEPRDNL